MDDQLNPRPTNERDRASTERWRDMQRGSYGSIGAVAAIVGALFVALLLWGMWSGGTDRTDTQVGQNVERTTPDAPRNPNAPPNTNK